MCYENYISKLSVGDIIDAHVTKIVGYGIFCDIGCGIIALLPTNNISVTHIVNPTVELKGLSTLKVIVKSIKEDNKIELTHKELLGTWKEQIAQFAEGDLVKGTVLSVEDYGVFIRLSQNLSGLAEVPETIELKPGDIVSTRIQSIQDKNMKVKLSVVEKIEDNDDKLIKFKYYVNEPHITDWVYSTETAKKQISSHFE
jgi:small subunit ribosomal protein S1